jgi:hypothetical protein
MTLMHDEVELVLWATSRMPIWQPLPGEDHLTRDACASCARIEDENWHVIAREVEAERAWAEIVAEFRPQGVTERP